MTSDERELKHFVDRHLPSPSRMEFVAARDRVLRDLRAVPPHLQKRRLADAPLAVSWVRTAVQLAAAAALIATVATVSFQPGDWLATVHAADGSTYTLKPNEVLRASAAGGAMLTLRDGSSVEMRAASELSVERAADGLDIRLRDGDIIIEAAKQRDGHLYVHTRDVAVAVDGTVFLVNAGSDGSRVAVIEGEVRVRDGAAETRLRSGEEVATSLTIARRPVKEDIIWSRNASAHLAILESFRKSVAQTAGPLTPLARQANVAGAQAPGAQAATPEFEEASIRECDPDNLPPLPAGARGGGANSFYMTPGRTYALCMTPATLIRTAYGYGPAELEFFMNGGLQGRGLTAGNVYGLGVENGVRVRGGPDWVRNEPYTIEAVADGAADGAAMSGPMLRALLTNRFRLKVHVETEQVPAFALTVAPGGLKIKPVQATGIALDGFVRAGARTDACEPGPPPDVPAVRIPRSFVEVRRGEKPSCGVTTALNGPNFVVVGGAAGMPALGRVLGARLGNVRVVDNTGITDVFNFILEFVLDENTPDGRINVPPPQMAAEPSSVPRGATIFRALEEQLGLKLEPARTPREFIVIDAIERPGPN